MISQPKGHAAAKLRQRKFEVLRRLRIPSDAIGGSLAEVRSRCGKPTCRCATGEGHPSWLLTFMVAGKKRVERVPAELLAHVQKHVEAGRAYKDAISEIFSANAELFVLARKQRKKR